ncbi:DUF2252 family protein [Streptomyces sp. SID8352]|uniref:DUF2252 family protein n=1 Tax=Streptomyces sp. SID8352 TaxID=2690338 RepID=UPI001371F979|nr:DUF2252 family protein [Streptomyces sp. SID8352]MYU21571.1 DUF2252 domain-containing protein [Streptomyces sp. SID8352]
MPVPQPDDERRGEEILAVLHTAFGRLPATDPDAYRARLRGMAGSALAFHSGAACLFHHDLAGEERGGPYLDERTSRVWTHGDLHAGRFGTRMDSTGRLVFGATGFDEAYVGPFTRDLRRFVTSVALICWSKALSDAWIGEVVRAYADAYRERVHALATGAKSDEVPPFTLDTAEGPLLGVLRRARALTRTGLLDSLTEVRDFERRFTSAAGAVELDAATRYKVLAAFDGYLETLPEWYLTRPDSYRVKDVVGRRAPGTGGSGPAASYDILLEGGSDALENDVVIRVERPGTPALSRHVADAELRDRFEHEGHRAVVSQRALQTHTDPWLGWTELDGTGRRVSEVSPYEAVLDWDALDDPEEMAEVAADLGRATAALHAAADDPSGDSPVPFATERAIDAALAADEEGFAPLLVDFAHEGAARARADHRILVGLLREGRVPGV